MSRFSKLTSLVSDNFRKPNQPQIIQHDPAIPTDAENNFEREYPIINTPSSGSIESFNKDYKVISIKIPKDFGS